MRKNVVDSFTSFQESVSFTDAVQEAHDLQQ